MDFSIKKVAEIVDAFLKAFRTEPILRTESANENGHGKPELSIDDEGLLSIQQLFLNDESGLEFLKNLDGAVYSHDGLMALGEYLVDFGILKLMVQVSETEGTDDVFDTKSWDEIEEKTMERGTELLNILVYLKDCIENHVRPSLEDFLNEFLLVADDEFQDEFQIYEPFIKNAHMLDSDAKAILSKGEDAEDDDIRDMFGPLMIFFQNPGNNRKQSMEMIKNYSDRPAIHMGMFALFNGFMDLSNEG